MITQSCSTQNACCMSGAGGRGPSPPSEPSPPPSQIRLGWCSRQGGGLKGVTPIESGTRGCDLRIEASRSRATTLLALVVQHMAVAGRRPGELGAAVGARHLGGLARLLALMPQEVAEGGELPPVAAMLPTAWLGPALHDPDMSALGRCRRRLAAGATRRHNCRHLVHHAAILSNRKRR